MSKRAKSNLIKYSCAILVVVLIALVFLQDDPIAGKPLAEQYRLLSDAFSIPGLMLIFSGLFIWVNNAGALDAISYCLNIAITALIPMKRAQGYEKYGDYLERRRGKAIKGYSFLFVVGAAAVAVSLVFAYLYSTVHTV